MASNENRSFHLSLRLAKWFYRSGLDLVDLSQACLHTWSSWQGDSWGKTNLQRPQVRHLGCSPHLHPSSRLACRGRIPRRESETGHRFHTSAPLFASSFPSAKASKSHGQTWSLELKSTGELQGRVINWRLFMQSVYHRPYPPYLSGTTVITVADAIGNLHRRSVKSFADIPPHNFIW